MSEPSNKTTSTIGTEAQMPINLTQATADKLLQECDDNLRAMDLKTGEYDTHARITHNKTKLGSCKTTKLIQTGHEPIPHHQISVSTNAGDTIAEIMDVLYHELIHTMPGCQNHGTKFKQIANLVNSTLGTHITVTKKAEPTDRDNNKITHSDAITITKSLIGHPIHIGRYDYKIMGIDSHYPKRSVLLVRTKDNVKARCTPELIARQTNK